MVELRFGEILFGVGILGEEARTRKIFLGDGGFILQIFLPKKIPSVGSYSPESAKLIMLQAPVSTHPTSLTCRHFPPPANRTCQPYLV
jgi:hypothetical protein